jgi:hypothetical protein
MIRGITPMTRGAPLVALLVTALPQPATGRQADDFSRLEADIVREHNLARRNPRAYAAYLEELLPFFDGRLLRLPGEIPLRTREGAPAVREAIAFLRRQDSVGTLAVSRGMARGARDHVRDSGPRGRLEHVGTDGSNSWDRVNRYGSWQNTIGENLSFGAYGPGEARDVVMHLIIDDGVRDRAHRDNIFNPDFHVIGVACGPHARYGVMCVAVYAGGYEEGAHDRFPIPSSASPRILKPHA